MAKVRYGIIGIGKMGSSHARKILRGVDKNAVLSAVADISEERRSWAEKNLKNVKIFSNAEDLIASPEVDAIIVATPHYFHPEYGIKALKAGKHVLLEKPAGVFTKAVKELNKVAAEEKELVFGIMYNQRTDPMYRKAKEIIESGELGKIKRINWIITNWYRPQAYYDQGGWRGTWEGEGGGVLINQCPHQLDLFQWLGGMPKKVYGFAKVGVERNINVENDVTFYTEYENGASGIFITSTHDFPGTNRLEISGDGGQIVVEWKGLLSEKLTYTKLNTKESEFNKTNTKFMPLIPSKKIKKRISTVSNAIRLGLIGQHINIIRNFSKAVLFGEKLIAPGVEGVNGLMLSNAVYLSSWTNKPITFPLNEDEFIKELEKRKEEEKASGKRRERMEKIKVGVQLFTLRNYLKKPQDVPVVFNRVKKMGAEVVQISHMCDISSKELAKISKDYDLPICITHASVERMKNDLGNLAEEHLEYDCKNMGIGMMPKEYREDSEGLKKFIEFLNGVAESLRKYNMKVAYHNHHFEFKKYDERTIYDVMIEETIKDVHFIPDTFWIKVGGYDPNDYIKKLSGRINTLHLKDYMKILGVPIFRAIGFGNLNFSEIMVEAENSQVENAVIELDISPNPFKSVEKSLKYMKSIY